MKKAYAVVVFLSVSSALFGCGKPYRLDPFISQEQITSKIPRLEVKIADSFYEKLPGGFRLHYYSDPIRGVTKLDTSSSHFRLTDARNLLKRETENNICEYSSLSESVGTATWHLEKLEWSVNPVWAIPSCATIFCINALGFPFGSQTYDIELTLDIRDSKGVSVGRYVANGHGKVWGASWGYNINGSIRKEDGDAMARAGMSEALSDAVQKIKAELEANAETIRRVLLSP